MLPWTDTTTLDQRRAFIAAWIAGQDSVGESLGATIPQPAPPRAPARERERAALDVEPLPAPREE